MADEAEGGDSKNIGGKRRADSRPGARKPKAAKTQHPAPDSEVQLVANALKDAVSDLQRREEEFKEGVDKAPDRLALAKEIYVAIANAIAKVRAVEDLEYKRAFWEDDSGQDLNQYSVLATIEPFVFLYKLLREDVKKTLTLSDDEVDKEAKLHLEGQASALGLSEIEVDDAANYLQQKNKLYEDIEVTVRDKGPGHSEFIHEYSILTTPHIRRQESQLPEQREQLVWRLKQLCTDIIRVNALVALHKKHLEGTEWSLTSLQKEDFITVMPGTYVKNHISSCKRIYNRLEKRRGGSKEDAGKALKETLDFLRQIPPQVFRVTSEDVRKTVKEIQDKVLKPETNALAGGTAGDA